jgi:hypothetical protein
MSIFTYLRDKKLSSNRNFFFESNHNAFTASLENTSKLYTHVCDCNLAFVHVRNKLFKLVVVSFKTRFDLFTEYEKKECFQIKSEYHEWVIITDEVEADKNF